MPKALFHEHDPCIYWEMCYTETQAGDEWEMSDLCRWKVSRVLVFCFFMIVLDLLHHLSFGLGHQLSQRTVGLHRTDERMLKHGTRDQRLFIAVQAEKNSYSLCITITCHLKQHAQYITWAGEWKLGDLICVNYVSIIELLRLQSNRKHISNFMWLCNV